MMSVHFITSYYIYLIIWGRFITWVPSIILGGLLLIHTIIQPSLSTWRLLAQAIRRRKDALYVYVSNMAGLAPPRSTTQHTTTLNNNNKKLENWVGLQWRKRLVLVAHTKPHCWHDTRSSSVSNIMESWLQTDWLMMSKRHWLLVHILLYLFCSWSNLS